MECKLSLGAAFTTLGKRACALKTEKKIRRKKEEERKRTEREKKERLWTFFLDPGWVINARIRH